MIFNSYIFICAFLPIVLSLYIFFRRSSHTQLITALLVTASLFYYAWWEFSYIYLLLLSISVNYTIGRKIIGSTNRDKTDAKNIFFLNAMTYSGVVFNLFLLGYYKYAGLLTITFNDLTGSAATVPEILLPIGISFFTFQQIAFLLDARKGIVTNPSLANYALFVTFFPQLIAGPIVHHKEMMPQFENHFRKCVRDNISIGLSIFVIGLFKKVVIADSFAIYADQGYSSIAMGWKLSSLSAWLTAISYSFQLYFDFSGYSDMAVGLARMFGIKLPMNFNSPYKSKNIIEFWRRWHMTLSRFLRDYLYIPLGGNRNGGLRTHINVAIVMLLGGLWHGASWNFVLWGAVHGALLILNHLWQALQFSKSVIFQNRVFFTLSTLATFMLVTIAWVPFRATGFDQTKIMLSLMFSENLFDTQEFITFLVVQFDNIFTYDSFKNWFKAPELWPSPLPENYISTEAFPIGLLLVVGVFITFFLPNTCQFFAKFDPVIDAKIKPAAMSISKLNGWFAACIAILFVVVVLKLSRVSPFLYFQF